MSLHTTRKHHWDISLDITQHSNFREVNVETKVKNSSNSLKQVTNTTRGSKAFRLSTYSSHYSTIWLRQTLYFCKEGCISFPIISGYINTMRSKKDILFLPPCFPQWEKIQLLNAHDNKGADKRGYLTGITELNSKPSLGFMKTKHWSTLYLLSFHSPDNLAKLWANPQTF